MSELYIVKDDGTLLYYNQLEAQKKTSIENATLFSGIISAIKHFLEEVEAGTIQEFQTNEKKIYIKNMDTLNLILIVDKKKVIDSSTIQNFLEKVAGKLSTIIEQFELKKEIHWNDKAIDEINLITDNIFKEFQLFCSESEASKKLMDTLW